MNQQAVGSLLEGSIQKDQNNLGDLLLQNETDTEETNEQGTDKQDPEDQQQLSGDDTTTDTSAESLPKSQSDIVKQDIQDTALLERIFPDILSKLDSKTLLKQINSKELFEQLILPHLEVRLTGDSKEAYNSGSGSSSLIGTNRYLITVQTPSCTDTSVDPKDYKLATGGGGQIDVSLARKGAVIGSQLPDDALVGSRPGNLPGTWSVQAITEGKDVVTAYVKCFGIEVTVRRIEREYLENKCVNCDKINIRNSTITDS